MPFKRRLNDKYAGSSPERIRGPNSVRLVVVVVVVVVVVGGGGGGGVVVVVAAVFLSVTE